MLSHILTYSNCSFHTEVIFVVEQIFRGCRMLGEHGPSNVTDNKRSFLTCRGRVRWQRQTDRQRLRGTEAEPDPFLCTRSPALGI